MKFFILYISILKFVYIIKNLYIKKNKNNILYYIINIYIYLKDHYVKMELLIYQKKLVNYLH